LLVLGLASSPILHARRASAGGAASAPAEEGKRAFAVGVALLQDPEGAKYEEAAAQFHRAYELTKSWKVLGTSGSV